MEGFAFKCPLLRGLELMSARSGMRCDCCIRLGNALDWGIDLNQLKTIDRMFKIIQFIEAETPRIMDLLPKSKPDPSLQLCCGVSILTIFRQFSKFPDCNSMYIFSIFKWPYTIGCLHVLIILLANSISPWRTSVTAKLYFRIDCAASFVLMFQSVTTTTTKRWDTQVLLQIHKHFTRRSTMYKIILFQFGNEFRFEVCSSFCYSVQHYKCFSWIHVSQHSAILGVEWYLSQRAVHKLRSLNITILKPHPANAKMFESYALPHSTRAPRAERA